MGIFLKIDFRQDFQMLKLILFLYRVVSVIGGHQRKLGPDLEENLLLAIHGFGNVLVKVM